MLFAILNPIVRLLLRSPLHRTLSRTTILLTFVGRKSGKVFTTPVSYMRDGDTITCFTTGRWWRNLEGGAPVTVRVEGRDLAGTATASRDHAQVSQGLQRFLLRVPRDARMYGVPLDAQGKPDTATCKRVASHTAMIVIALAEPRPRLA